MRIIRIIFLLIPVAFSSCKKEDEKTTTGTAVITFAQEVDGDAVEPDTFNYVNAVGNNYQITTLEYYVSKLVFEKVDGSVFDANLYQYINPAKPSTLQLKVEDIPNGDYSSISFVFGIDSARNKKLGLGQPPKQEDVDMEWPEFLGGGYHFMRLEGYFKDTADDVRAYAVHLGRTPNQVRIRLPQSALKFNGDTHTFTISMNINNWFKAPHKIDLNDDYSSIMGDSVAQSKFKANAAGVFSLKELN